ncbi:MAG TPA: hypothetical protein VKG92_09560, partial [Flavobacteriales bacterium]|nr:hypothetical protein [Flavobacteriales bacterium]
NTDTGSLTKTITGNTFTNITTGAAAITIMTINGGWGTTLSGTTITNVTGQAAITGIARGTSGSGTDLIQNNNITTLASSGTGGAIVGLSSGVPSICTISGNTITGLSTTSTTATITGLTVSGGAAVELRGNQVYTLSNLAAAPTTPSITGLSVTGGTTIKVYKNKVGDILMTGGATSVPAINGMLFSAGTIVNAYDNLVGDLRAPAASSSEAIRGISVTSATANSAYNLSFNTVLLNAAAGGATFGTTGLFHTISTTTTTATLNLRSNIIVNNSVFNGTGLAVAYRRSAGAASSLANYGSLSNNNLFYAGTPGASRLIYADGTSTAQTLAAYKAGAFTAGTIGPRDNQSVTENPTFLSTAVANANFLHIDATVATQVESGGTPAGGISDDYDSQARNVSTPDIGADEGPFILLDLSGPAISYTALGNSSCLTGTTLTATITDPSGVNSLAGTLPRLYYKLSTEANAFVGNTSVDNGWKFVEASNAVSPYSFTFNYTLLTATPVVGNTIQYFVVAQDLVGTPNVSINSGAFSAAQTSVAIAGGTTIGAPINQFTVNTSGISGLVTIGAAGTYTSITGAGGLFSAINTLGMSGAVTANITDASVTET